MKELLLNREEVILLAEVAKLIVGLDSRSLCKGKLVETNGVDSGDFYTFYKKASPTNSTIPKLLLTKQPQSVHGK